jgi:hypothetical protein
MKSRSNEKLPFYFSIAFFFRRSFFFIFLRSAEPELHSPPRSPGTFARSPILTPPANMADNAVLKNLEAMRGIDAAAPHRVIEASFSYPATAALRPPEMKPLLQSTYRCTRDAAPALACDFSTVHRDIKNSVDLRANASQEIMLAVLEDIGRHRDDYVPHKMDGFVVERSGVVLAEIRREDSDGRGRVGYLDYETLRRKTHDALEALARQRSLANPSNCSIM